MTNIRNQSCNESRNHTKLKKPNNFSLSFGNQSLKQSNVVKFLGVYLDEHLTWKHHISFVCKQIAKSIGILFRSRFYLSVKLN